MRRIIASTSAAFVLAMSAFTGLSGLAQEQTPSAADVPPAEECQVEPRTLGSLLEFVGTPVPDEEATAEAAAEPTPFVVPEGEPADDDTVEAISAAMRELLACANAGDYLRAFALFSDDFFRRLAAEQGLSAEDLNELDTQPTPLAGDERLGFLLWDARVLPDDRVGAIVMIAEVGETDDPDYVIFVEKGDRWLLDEVIEDVGESLTTPES